MNIILKLLLATLITISVLSPVAAGERNHRSCDGNSTIDFKQMGLMNEESLQEYLDNTKQQIKMFRHAPRFHFFRKQEQKRNLSDAMSAMQTLHNQMYVDGCKEAVHGAFLEARVAVIEKSILR